MTGLYNFLQWISDNWGMIVACAALIYGIYKKAKYEIEKWQAKSETEKQEAQNKAIEEARSALSHFVLALCADAEVAWDESKGEKLGEIRRSTVLKQIYETYPILLSVADQDELIEYIDNLIKMALKTVRKTVRTDDNVSE